MSDSAAGAGWQDPQAAMRVVAAVLALYALAFAFTYPRVVTNDDESSYIRQTTMLVQGEASFLKIHPLSGVEVKYLPSSYAPGTALTFAPFVAVAGWRGAFAASCLSLLAMTGLVALWLRQEGRSPLFALLVLGFPPALVMGRVAMSDVPSGALVAFGLWLFWRGLDRSWRWWLAAGFVAGASMLWRTSNPLAFIPLFAGAVLRREPKAAALVIGGVAGLGLRLLVMDAIFGSSLYDRSAYNFAPHTIGDRLPFYLLGLLVFVPGGLFFGLLYKGRRRPEVVATVVLFFGFYLLQTFSSFGTGSLKRVVLALRYFVPLLPILAFAMAESVPRLWEVARSRLGETRRSDALARVAVRLWVAGVAVASVGVHVYLASWAANQSVIRDLIEAQVPNDAVLVSNKAATRKFLREELRTYVSLDRDRTPPRFLPRLAERWGNTYLVLLDRSDSSFWRADAERTVSYVADAEQMLVPLEDRRISETERLRIWRVTSGEDESAATAAEERARER